ncbi:hypothetical protein CH063_05650 [Colletotrichum higginsianum]|uniref:Uncharacterized protein n=1 Tax=Colletotrichum higginsianum (strain IMI 349063) TaxID=759273 RepID=H1UZR0_COLHI|nr:hypothetical protein CH063_05650 [Colletotrichum higginsianum]
MACLLILNNGHRTAKRSQHLNQTSRAYCYNKHNHGREWSLSDPSERLPLGHTPPPFYPGKGVFPSKHSARHETLGFQCSSNCLLRKLPTLTRMVSAQSYYFLFLRTAPRRSPSYQCLKQATVRWW